MSALPPAEHPNNNGQPNDTNDSESADSSSAQEEVAEMDTTPDQRAEETWDDIPEEIMELDTEDVLTRIRLIDNDIKVRWFPICCDVSEIIFATRSCVQSSCG
jgi:26S proteasome regulatory subunit T5